MKKGFLGILSLLFLGSCSSDIEISIPTDIEVSRLLVANTEGNNVIAYSPTTGSSFGTFIAEGSGGLFRPDSMILGPDANDDGEADIYISNGNEVATSGTEAASNILIFSATSGTFISAFVSDDTETTDVDETGGLNRPYGIAFNPDGMLYVANFLTDQILRYDENGVFVDVFAQGNGETGGLNGPDGLLFDSAGNLYVTTQGSIQGTFDTPLPSQILRYDSEGNSSVFATPEASNTGKGFVSLLGLAWGPDDGDLYVSDFSGSVIRYNLDGSVAQRYDTNFDDTVPAINCVGSLAFNNDGHLLVAGFDNREGNQNQGAVLKFEPSTGVRLGADQTEADFFVSPTTELQRPIGVLTYTANATQ